MSCTYIVDPIGPVATWSQIHWFAIHTKPNKEDVAVFNLQRAQLEVFLPMRKLEVADGARQIRTKPLFPGYLFARFCPATHFHLVQFARGVRRVISAAGSPIEVEEEIVQRIKARVGADGFVALDRRQLRPGESVLIESGPLKGRRGIFEQELDDSARVILLLQEIEYQGRVSIERRHLSADAAQFGASTPTSFK